MTMMIEIHVLYLDGKLRGGIRELVRKYGGDYDHEETVFTLYNGETWATYGPVEYHACEAGGTYYIDSAYSWRI